PPVRARSLRRAPFSPPAESRHRCRRGRSSLGDALEVLDGRKWVVEVVQQCSPILIGGRSAKTLGVVAHCRPLNEEKVAIRLLDTAREPEGAKPTRRGDQRCRPPEGVLEGSLLARSQVQHGMFDDHESIIRAPGTVALMNIRWRSSGTAASGC